MAEIFKEAEALADTSKRGYSTAHADAFTGVNAEEKARHASVGMTVWLALRD
jgi:hypothetical protein